MRDNAKGKGTLALEMLSKAINHYGDKEEVEDGFVEAFLTEHRTLQQGLGGLFLKALYELAEQADRCGHDARNADLVTAARKVRETLGEDGYVMRFI